MFIRVQWLEKLIKNMKFYYTTLAKYISEKHGETVRGNRIVCYNTTRGDVFLLVNLRLYGKKKINYFGTN